ncbi:GIY-YIG nuclease family protein [Candidatus Woesearchaeota archaeon]|nr:GIY-YIG nuclease family protein [Candidatus Woesearchaeota archaeon]
MSIKHKVVTGYAKMWPREVFDIKEGKRLLDSIRQLLSEPGVYVLYRDDLPYYVGKTTKPLFNRIWAHANKPKDKYYNFWNFFSAFVVPHTDHISEVEGLLIAAMPTSNSANPKISRIDLPREVGQILHRLRRIDKE